MNLYTKENKVISVIRNNFKLLPVLNRFGIKLGVKDKTIEEICAENKINVQFFLAIINTYANQHYFPKSELLSFSPELIIEYLRKTHKYYANYIIPNIEETLNKLIASSKGNNPNILLIQTFYAKYKEEFLGHNQNEEAYFFPYVLELSKNKETTRTNPVEGSYEKEHLNIDDKLQDLKNLLLKYLEGDFDDNIYNEFIYKLNDFEKDAKDHARIEDAILIPIARELENKLQ